ncbi:MAG: C39 family peptidase [Ignavibacteriales bacterium]|nr:C39 family peptidase [Ignavibacteriales bacterium]
MIPLKILPQPDDVSCGPTSLHSVYNFYGDNIALQTVISEIQALEEGGTLAVILGNHALKRGYKAKIYTFNVKLFDPSWFGKGNVDLSEKLTEQKKHKRSKKLQMASDAYLEFLQLGGKVLFKDLTIHLLRKYFESGVPVLTGLSATYLYNEKREYSPDGVTSIFDDVRGLPMGHFVVLCGYDNEKQHIIVADPFAANPVSGNNYYSVRANRLIHSIMLGIVTYDANLLIITPK